MITSQQYFFADKLAVALAELTEAHPTDQFAADVRTAAQRLLISFESDMTSQQYDDLLEVAGGGNGCLS